MSRTFQETVAKGLGDRLEEEVLMQHTTCTQWICEQTPRAWHMWCAVTFLGVVKGRKEPRKGRKTKRGSERKEKDSGGQGQMFIKHILMQVQE